MASCSSLPIQTRCLSDEVTEKGVCHSFVLFSLSGIPSDLGDTLMDFIIVFRGQVESCAFSVIGS